MEPEKNTPHLENEQQSNGSFKTVENKDAALYLGRLKTRLVQLSAIQTREGDNIPVHFMESLINSIELLELKYQLKGEEKIDFDLTISAKESGFPTERDFYSLKKNAEEAENILNSSPKKRDVIGRLRKGLLHEIDIVPYQDQLRRVNFFTELTKTDSLFAGYHLYPAQSLENKGGRRKYNITWSCMERGTKLPVFYRMCLEQDRKAEPLENGINARLETLIYRTAMGPLDTGALARVIDNEIAEVHPKLVEKYTVGPFYDYLTENSKEMSEILKESDEASVLKFSILRVVSDRVSQHCGGLIDVLLRKKNEREVFSRVCDQEGIIVPFRAVQEMKGKDVYGNQCRVYGVTKGGEIVG